MPLVSSCGGADARSAPDGGVCAACAAATGGGHAAPGCPALGEPHRVRGRAEDRAGPATRQGQPFEPIAPLRTLRVLHLEDSDLDHELTLAQLQRGGWTWDTARRLEPEFAAT